MKADNPRRRAFALVELVVVVGVVGAALVVLALCSGDSRRRARLAGSVENLQQFASSYQSFSKDNLDHVATFTWRAGINYGFGGVAGSDLQAAANQAMDIIRRRGNRADAQPIQSWVPQILYNHLVLVDYLEQELPAKWFVSPGDTQRLAWQRDPVHFESLPPNSRPPGGGALMIRWPYSSSYEIPPAFYSPDQAVGAQTTITQAQSHNQYLIPGGNGWMGNRLMSEIAFPAQKAMVYETVQRFFGPRQAYFSYTEARVPVMSADGSVLVRTTGMGNPGFQPNSPSSPSPTTFNYQPDTNYEVPPLNGNPSGEFVQGYLRWCKRGLLGRNFGGPEVP